MRGLGVSSINNLKISFLKVLNRLNGIVCYIKNAFHDIQKVDDLFWHISEDSANFLKWSFVQTQAVLHEHTVMSIHRLQILRKIAGSSFVRHFRRNKCIFKISTRVPNAPLSFSYLSIANFIGNYQKSAILNSV